VTGRPGAAVVRGTTRVAAVLGWPVEHSCSPALLNAAFAAAGVDAVLVALAVPPARLADAVRGLAAAGLYGASVTMPHKAAAAAAADRLEPPADQLGVANCLVFDDGRVVGHNTDAGGFVDGLAARGWDPRGWRCVLLGAGGAARAVAAGLAGAGATADVIARRPDAAPWTRARPWTAAELAAAFATADLVVDCTPAALDPAAEAPMVAALPLAALPAAARVASLVYHRRPALLAAAAARGLATIDGRAMLVHQGARAFTLWTGRPAPVAAMSAALDAALT
jgi:shikimate dehydrogenase